MRDDGARAIRLARGFLRHHRSVRWLVVAYAALNLLDLATTYLALTGGAHETSLLYAPLFAHTPFLLGAAVKLLVAALLLALAFFLACWPPLVSPHSFTLVRSTLAVLCALLALAVLINLHTLAALTWDV